MDDVTMATKGIRSRPIGQPIGGKCSHCGNTRHTSDVCFKVYGYPDWWQELKAKKKREKEDFSGNTGRAANVGKAPYISNNSRSGEWIIDSEATDHMTFDPCDFSKITPPRRTIITNAN